MKHVKCVEQEQIIQVKTRLNPDMVMQKEPANSVLGVVTLGDLEKHKIDNNKGEYESGDRT